MSTDSLESEPVDAGRSSISERPIEAGAYSWGWVDYGDYGQDGKPQSISVVMFDEPTDPGAMGSLRRWSSRPYWLTMLICYGPVISGAVAVSILGGAQGQSWISHLALGTTILSGWQIWKHTRNGRTMAGALELTADRRMEDYIAGRELLRTLADSRLQRG